MLAAAPRIIRRTAVLLLLPAVGFTTISIAAMRGVDPAVGAAPEPLVARLQTRLDHLSSLKGRFIQSLDSKSLGRPRTEEGRFCLRKPSFMRWDYEKPEEKLAILDGKNSWLYLPGDREVYRGQVTGIEDASAPALLLAGRLKLDADFESRRLTPAEAGPQGVSGAVTVELKPRKPSEDFERLLIAIDPERLLIRRITLVDSLGGRMVFELYDLEENPALADELFRFEVPAGVDVIESR